MEGWVKIHRKLLDWQWFKDKNTFHLFMYCIIRANCKPSRFMGVQVQRGQFATSYPTISNDTGLTIQQARTALQHLKATGQLTVKTYPKFSVITVTAYEQYQCCQHDIQQPNNSQVTGDQQSSNSQVTGDQQQYKNIKNIKNERIQEDIQNKRKRTVFTPPTLDEVKAYIAEKGYSFDAEAFIDYYAAVDWMRKGQKVKNWHSLCGTWHKNESKYDRPQQQKPKTVNAQKYEQRTNDLDGAFAQFTPQELAEIAAYE